jgi:hypothetical protein
MGASTSRCAPRDRRGLCIRAISLQRYELIGCTCHLQTKQQASCKDEAHKALQCRTGACQTSHCIPAVDVISCGRVTAVAVAEVVGYGMQITKPQTTKQCTGACRLQLFFNAVVRMRLSWVGEN